MVGTREKAPDLARRNLLDAAAGLAETGGVGAVTMDAVARRAEFSKGGLLHHFPSKRALLEGLVDDAIAGFEKAINLAMDESPAATARFSRAYLAALSAGAWARGERSAGLLALLIAADAGLRARWNEWLGAQLKKHAATDASPEARIIRLAADGLWLSELTGGPDAKPAPRRMVVKRLAALFEEG